MLCDNTIGSIATPLQVGDLGGEQPGVKYWAETDALDVFYRLRSDKCRQEREKRGGTNSQNQVLREIIHQCSSANVCLPPSCTANCALKNEIF